MKSEEVRDYLKWHCTRAKQKFNTPVKQMIPAYKTARPNEPIILAIVDEIDKNSQQYNDIPIVQRKYRDISNEATDLYNIEKEITFSEKEQSCLEDCIKSHAETLMRKHSNLLIIRASKFKCRNYNSPNKSIRPEVCIVLYVHVKGIIPLGEDPFPDNIDGIPVDVRESLFNFSVSPKEYLCPLMMGCYFESAHGKSGTLGGFVKDENGDICCITACHIFQPEIGQAGFNKDVYQPVNQPDYKFGEVLRHCFGEKYNNEITVDAALIKITDPRRVPKSGRFPDAESINAGKFFVY